MVIDESLNEVGITSVITPEILFVSETVVVFPRVNPCPVSVRLPVVIAVEEIF